MGSRGARLLGIGSALGFCTAWALLDGGAGLVAGALASGSLGPKLEGLAQSVVQGVSGWWINQKVARDEAARERELPETRLLLENHHLLQLLELALIKTLRSARGQEGFQRHEATLAALERASQGLFHDLAKAHGGELQEELRVPNLLIDAENRPAFTEEDGDTLVDTLEKRSALDLGILRPRLRGLLREKFPSVLEGLLKLDVHGRTPLRGQAYAALWLQVQRKFAADLTEVRAILGDVPERFAELERRQTATLEAGLRQIRVRSILREEHLKTWLRELQASLTLPQQAILDAQKEALARLDQLEKVVLERGSESLTSLETFEKITRERVGRAPFLGSLVDEPQVQAVLDGDPLGRDEELDEFVKFLDASSLKVHYWKAVPGAGKTRLCIAAAALAQERSWLPLFLEVAGEDPAQALLAKLRFEKNSFRSARVLLVWDTSANSISTRQAETIYRLPSRGVFWEAGIDLKILVVSWPIHARVLEAPQGDPSNRDWFSVRELAPLGSQPEFRELIQGLLPVDERSRLDEWIQKAEGNALDCFSIAIALREGGVRASGDVIGDRYRKLLRVAVLDGTTMEREPALDVLRSLAFRLELDESAVRQALRASPERAERWISAARTLTTALDPSMLGREDDGAFHLAPDRFRIELVRLTFLSERDEFALHRSDWKKELGPWIEPESFDGAFSLVQEALRESPQLAAVNAFLFDCLPDLLAKARAWCSSVLTTRADERDGTLRKMDALVAVQPTVEIALELARALMNATIGDRDPRLIEARANRIDTLLRSNGEFATPEIALELASALLNATAVEPDPWRREAQAKRIETVLRSKEEFATPEIALVLAKALVNTAIVEPDPRQREALADRIEALLRSKEEFATPEIALVLAKALLNATANEPDPRKCEARANRIEALLRSREEFATPEIALVFAMALMNLTIVQPDLRQREARANRIEALLCSREEFATPEIALELAKALMNATVGEPDPRLSEAQANRIDALIRSREDFATPEIALELAKALYSATVVEPDPSQGEAQANRIDALLRSKEEFATPEIALMLARALMNATVNEQDPRQREARANRIDALLGSNDKFATPQIALQLAKALVNATSVEPDPGLREARANRIDALTKSKEEFATPEIALMLAWALLNTTLIEPDLGKREALANRIDVLLRSKEGFATPEIALALEKARKTLSQ